MGVDGAAAPGRRNGGPAPRRPSPRLAGGSPVSLTSHHRRHGRPGSAWFPRDCGTGQLAVRDPPDTRRRARRGGREVLLVEAAGRRVPRCPTDRRGGDDELLRVHGAASGRSTTCRGDGRGGISGGGRRIGPMRTLGPRTNADERNLLAELNAAIDDDGGPSTGSRRAR